MTINELETVGSAKRCPCNSQQAPLDSFNYRLDYALLYNEAKELDRKRIKCDNGSQFKTVLYFCIRFQLGCQPNYIYINTL